ncbi:lipid-A-disaccharide synthase [bacterium]
MADSPLVVLSCGEASGDLYCSMIARALLARRADLRLAGIAGPLSRAAGVEPWARQESLAVMGFVEIVRYLPRFFRLGNAVVERAEREGAALFLPIDYPGFHLRVAASMKKRGIAVLDFIPPKTWSWGRHRLGALRRSVDRSAVIFPFEEQHYREAGVQADFVGHPLADIHADALATDSFERDGLLLAPGSRKQELVRLVPILVAAIRLLREQGYVDSIKVSQAPGVDVRLLQPLLDAGAVLASGELFAELRTARAAVVCSGTATVEAALAGTAHVIVYRTGALTYQIARRLASVEHIGMANIILGRRAFPELLQGDLTAAAVARSVRPLLDPGSEASAGQLAAGAELRAALGAPGCFDRVAQMALSMLPPEVA